MQKRKSERKRMRRRRRIASSIKGKKQDDEEKKTRLRDVQWWLLNRYIQVLFITTILIVLTELLYIHLAGIISATQRLIEFKMLLTKCRIWST